MYPKVSIILLNWNGKEDTIECLESLNKIDYPNYEIILVDNGSTDGSVEYFRERFPEIEIIQNKENLGFAEGNNVGIERAIRRRTDYVLLQNNDTIVDPFFLKELVDIIEKDKNIGVVGPTVYYYNETNKIQSAGGKIWWYIGRAAHLKKNTIDKGKINKPQKVDYIPGCSLLARSKIFKEAGYLNKNYFAYWEESDWCIRVHKAGYDILYVPEAKIWHKGGSTSGKISGFSEYHMTRNMFWFMKQHAAKRHYISFLFFFFGFELWFFILTFIVNRNIGVTKYFLRGIRDGIKTSQNI